MVARYINGHITSGTRQGMQQSVRLRAAAASEFDHQDLRAYGIRDFGRPLTEYSDLGSCRVVLVELADAIEESRPLGIIEIFAGQRL